MWVTISQAVEALKPSSASGLLNGFTHNLSHRLKGLISPLTWGYSGFPQLSGLVTTTTYNQNSNKLTFTHSQNNFMFMSNSTCFSILGFNDNTTVISTALSLTSINCVNVYNIKTIQVNSNLITYNINKVQKNNYCILCSVPVSSQPFSLIEYINRTNFRTNLFLNRIQKLKIRLTDDNGNLIDLNGCHYTMTLQLDVIDFT